MPSAGRAQLEVRWTQGADFTVLTLNGPAQVGEEPLTLPLDQLKRINAAMGERAVDMKVVRRPKRGDIASDQYGRIPDPLE